MLNEKKIEEATKLITEKYRYYTTLSNVDRDKVVKSSFSDGAHWAIQEFLKDLWHDASEEPKSNNKKTYIVIQYNDDSFSICMLDWLNDYLLKDWSPNGIINRWLYLDDLLPKQKGGEE